VFGGSVDIQAMLADLKAAGAAVDVTLASTTVTGLRDHEAVEILGAEMPGIMAGDESVHIETGSLPGLASGVDITVAGAARKVLRTGPYGDGAMTRIVLRTP